MTIIFGTETKGLTSKKLILNQQAKNYMQKLYQLKIGEPDSEYSTATEIKTKIVKKFGVHICIFQSTVGDQYQGGD